MLTKHSLLLGALLSLLMAGLGFTLVKVLRRQEPLTPPASQSRPESPREVVEAYWRLSGEGKIDEAARYLADCDNPTNLVKRSTAEDGWAAVIRERHLRITGFEGGVAHPSGATEVIATATSDTDQAFRLRLRHTLCVRNGEWKISGIY